LVPRVIYPIMVHSLKYSTEHYGNIKNCQAPVVRL
jgi:hypothetical protein